MKIFYFLWDCLFMYICLIYCIICGRIAQLYMYPERERIFAYWEFPSLFSCLKYIETIQGRIQQERVGEKKKHEIFHFYHTFARHKVVGCLPPPLLWKIGPKMFTLPTWNFGIRPCNCVFKNVCITIHVLWIIIAICYCYYELWIKESRFIGINSLIKDRY